MVLCGISTPFGVLFPCLGKVAHALLTRPPLKQSVASYQSSPLDLHVLGTPPAFVLSQDQTLSFNPLFLNQVSPTKFHSFGITVLFALLLFCIVFKVRTSLASGFSAARATSFVSILLFRPLVKGVLERFLRFFAFFLDFRTISAFSRHHRSPFSEPSSLFPFSLFVRIIRRHLSACFHRQRIKKKPLPDLGRSFFM